MSQTIGPLLWNMQRKELFSESLKEVMYETGVRYFAFSRKINVLKSEYWWYGWRFIFVPGGIISGISCLSHRLVI